MEPQDIDNKLLYKIQEDNGTGNPRLTRHILTYLKNYFIRKYDLPVRNISNFL